MFFMAFVARMDSGLAPDCWVDLLRGGRLARFGGEDRDGLGFARPGVVALERVEREAHADGFVIFVAASEEMRLALFERPLGQLWKAFVLTTKHLKTAALALYFTN